MDATSTPLISVTVQMQYAVKQTECLLCLASFTSERILGSVDVRLQPIKVIYTEYLQPVTLAQLTLWSVIIAVTLLKVLFRN